MNSPPDRLPSRPLRNWFLAWHLHTGDPAKVIAKGFDLDLELVADLLSGDAPLMMPSPMVLEICAHLRIAPEAIWETEAVRGLLAETLIDADPAWSEIPERLCDAFGSR